MNHPHLPRELEYSLVDQELEDGVRAIAVPVRSSKAEVLTAMAVIAHASRVDIATIARDFLPR